MGVNPSKREWLVLAFVVLLAAALLISFVAPGVNIGDSNSRRDIASLSGENSPSGPAWTQTSWAGVETGYPPEVVTGVTDNYCRGENENGANGELRIAIVPTSLYDNGNKVTGDDESAGAMNASTENTSIRFTAQSGDSLFVENIRVFLHTEAGTSPEYTYGIQTDNGSGYPSGTWLSSANYTAMAAGWVTIDIPNAALTGGTIYHIVVAPSGTPDSENYIALRRLDMHSKTIPYDGRTDDNQNVLFYNGTSWTVQDKDPIYVLDYTNATYRGQPYHYRNYHIMDLYDYYYGENFSISENKLLVKISVYLYSDISANDNLHWVVFNVTDDNLVAEGLFATPDDVGISSFVWVEKSISPIRLTAGKRYRLYIKSPGLNSGRYFLWYTACSDLAPYRDLSYYGTNSFSIHSWDAGSSWTDNEYRDLLFYMTFAACKPAALLESSVFDAGGNVDWTTVTWNENVPSGTSLVVKLRSGNDNSPYLDGSYASDEENWSDWCVHDNNTENTSLPDNRYVQYRTELSTTDNTLMPKLYDITLNYVPVWQLIETWTGMVKAPGWHLIETWTGTVEAPAEWQLIETWTGTVKAPAAWQLIETWTGMVKAPGWHLIETWTGMVKAPAWHLIETWTGTVEAPIGWQLIETWTGTVKAPAWHLIETWTGTVEAPVAWQLIETWTGTVKAPVAWQLIETWTGTVKATPPSGKPQLYLPAYGTVTSGTPYFEWTPGENATYHRLVIDNSPVFSDGDNIYDNANIYDNTCTIENSLPEDNYYWKVIAINAGENESGVWTFVVDNTPPGAPNLNIPADGTVTTDNTPQFGWGDVFDRGIGCTYDIDIDNDNDFLSRENFATDLIGNAHTPSALPDENYSWRVRAIDNVGNKGDWSSVRTLLIDATPPAKPLLVSPADGENENDNTPLLDWENVPDNSLPVLYQVFISDNSEFPYENRTSPWVENDNWIVTSALPEGVWYWRVCAKDNAGNVGENSSQRSFRVDITPPGTPTLVSPENNATKNILTVTFTWTSVTDIPPPITYDIQIDNEASFVYPIHENTGLPENSYNYMFSAEDNYYWWVRARDNAGNYGGWADNFKLTISGAPPSQPMLLSPADGENIKDNAPTFTWENGANATYHRLVIDNGPVFSDGDNIYDNANIYDNTCTIENELPDDNYYWKVVAINANGENESAVRAFHIDTVAPAEPTLVWPDNVENISDNTPNLQWSAPFDISLPLTYYVWIDNDNDFSSPENESGWITDDNYTSGYLQDNLYYWHVCARDNAGNVGENSERTFRVDTLAPSAPTLIEPADGTKTNDNTPTFRWTAVTDENSLPVTYNIQIDNDNNFLSPENFAIGLDENKYILTTALVDENYSWHVCAVDNAGNDSDWSSVRTLLIDATPPAKPTLVWPADGENISDNIPNLNWDNVDDNTLPVLYKVFISDNSEFPYENRTSPWVENDNWVVTSALPEGLWYWRTCARDNVGNVGENSGARAFRVDVTQPGVPTLIRPADGENENDNTPNLNWNAVSENSRPVTYDVWVDNDNNFSPSVENETGITDDNYQVKTGLAEGVWYWRVRATDNAGNVGDNSITQSFRVDVTAPPAPALWKPDDGTIRTDNTPTFEWFAVWDESRPMTYDIDIDNDTNFLSRENFATGLIYRVYTPELADENYSWRVRAVDNAGNDSDWSSIRTLFIDATPPDPPVLLWPADGENINENAPNLRWENVEDISLPVIYDVWVDNDNDFSLPEISATTTDNSYQIQDDNSLAEGVWYWRVRATDNVGNVGDNSTQSFGVDIISPFKPTLYLPTDGTLTNDPTVDFEWTIGENAENHRLLVDNSPPDWENCAENVLLGATDNTYTPTTALADDNYSWKVIALDNAGNENVSSVWTFVVDTVVGKPTLYLPTDGTLTNDPTVDFEWTIGLNADNHRLLVDSSPPDWENCAENVLLGATGNTHTSGTLADDNYSWRVVAVDNAGNENVSSVWTFVIDAVVGKPTLYLPADGTFTDNSTVDFEWTIGSGADNHRIEIDDDFGFLSPVENDWYGPTGNTHTSGTLADDNYSWRVVAVDNAGNENVSSVWTFVIDTVAPDTPTLLEPTDGTKTTDNTPTFGWTAVTDENSPPVSYDIQVDNDNNFASPENSAIGLDENTYTPSALADENYSWRVRAVDNAGNASEWSSVWTLLIDATPPPTPTLISPANNAFDNDNTPMLDWTAVVDLSGVTYNLQVDDHSDFSSPLINATGITDDNYQIPDENSLAEGAWYWRVRAVDVVGGVSNWSDVYKFTVDITLPTKPTLVSPENNSLLSLTVSFSWIRPETGATYRIQIDNDADFSSLLYENTSVSENSYSYTFVSSGVYYWHVRAKDQAGNVSEWSDSFKLITHSGIIVTIGTIPQGESRSADFTPYDLVVTEIVITAADDLSNVRVAVENLAEKPVGVPAPSGFMYGYLDIVSNVSPSDVTSVSIRFKVAKSWVEENDVNKYTIVLLKFDGNWQKLSTGVIDEDLSYFYLEAKMSSLSVFAVVGFRQPVIPLSFIVALVAVVALAIFVSLRHFSIRRKRRPWRRKKKGRKRGKKKRRRIFAPLRRFLIRRKKRPRRRKKRGRRG